ncbi:MAG: hypothetical protein H0X31_24370, partial [Nostocaceae cyanobacterium]|nr:hypothetical protein [Nostocaceae cyanobacterium]
MELNKLWSLSDQIQRIYHKISLLQFWQEYPELESVLVDCTFEYDDEGGYYPSFHIQKLTFISQEAALKLLQNLFPDSRLEEQNVKWQDWDEDWGDWDEQLEFTRIDGLPTEDTTHVPPDNLEVEIAALQSELRTLLLSQLKGQSLYAITEPDWQYDDEHYYVDGGERLVDIYSSAEEAKAASIQRNLATVATTCFGEIVHEDMFDGNKPDECETPEEKLELWEKYAPDYLATVETVQLKLSLSRFMIWCVAHESRHHEWLVYALPICSL